MLQKRLFTSKDSEIPELDLIPESIETKKQHQP